MSTSLYAAISGLNASSKQLDVIGNNIANMNTLGYKSGKIYFSDILSQSVSGGSSSFMQVGRGVSVSGISTQFTPGSFETTGNATDLSIDGDGFFIVDDDQGGTYYTRAGAFHQDSEANLVDLNGYKVQGYNFFGSNPETIDDISLNNVQSEPETTTEFSIGANLNAEAANGETFNASQIVYDSLGGEHPMSVIFEKTEQPGYWSFKTTLDGNEAMAQSYHGLSFNSDGSLGSIYSSSASAVTVTDTDGGAEPHSATASINNPGQIYQTATMAVTRGGTEDDWVVTDDGGYANASVLSADATSVTIDLDGTGSADVTLALAGGVGWEAGDTAQFTLTHADANPTDVSLTFDTLSNGATIGTANVMSWDLSGNTAESMTGYATNSVVKALTNDGYASGVLQSLSVTTEGILSGFFTNGKIANIGQVVLADFSNPWGLKKVGSNLFAETLDSGAAIRNSPGSAGMGDITSNSLEMSNADMASEFINMITAQRAYQASAKIVTTSDEMMSTLLSVKR